MTEGDEYEGLASKDFRAVFNTRRARKLRKRGEYVWWSYHFNCWIWLYKLTPSVT